MPIYRIADLNVEVNPKFKIRRKRLESYAVKSNESGKTDIEISVSDDEIREHLRLSEYLSEQGAEDVPVSYTHLDVYKRQGKDGQNGTDGKNGKDGTNGKDGIGVTKSEIKDVYKRQVIDCMCKKQIV